MFHLTILLLLNLAKSILPVYRGFDATWLRKVIGFETPHRLSRLDSFISSSGSSLLANFGLSPGVDGDFAYPEIYYDLMESPNPSIVKNVTFRWKDNATRSNGSKWLTAEANFATSLPGSNPVLFLGFSMNTTCVDPDCGQHGIWPSVFRVGIESRSAFLQITRTESPDSERGDKPFIQQMAFTASIYYTEVAGVDIAHEPIVFFNDTIHSDGQTIQVELVNPATTVGIAALGFELFPTQSDDDLPLGRYIESMHFESKLLEESGKKHANLTFNLRSPLHTTHDSGVRYFIEPVTINSKASPTSCISKGSICVSGDQVGKIHINRSFVCANHGLQDQVQDQSLIV